MAGAKQPFLTKNGAVWRKLRAFLEKTEQTGYTIPN